MRPGKRVQRRRDWRTVTTPTGRLAFIEQRDDDGAWEVHIGKECVGTVASEEAAVALAEKRGGADE